MKVGKGYRLQNGIPPRFRRSNSTPNGLLLRGAVLATYVTDDLDHPTITDSKNLPVAVYCDVVIYSNLSYDRWFTLSQVLVSQKRGGLHDDDIWKPRATSKNVSTILSTTTGSNPGTLDGDHVLIGFLNNSFNEPVILKGLPHPSRDLYNELYDSGKRLKLKAIDGDPDFVKHHGVYHGVDDSGNYICDTTFGHNGVTDETGLEPLPDTTGTAGNQIHKLPKDSEFSVELDTMTSPLSPVEETKLVVKSENMVLTVSAVNSIDISGSGPTASLILGNGVVSVAIADFLEVLYASLTASMLTHTHTCPPGGGTTTGTVYVNLPSWDSNINSSKMKVPG